LLHSLRSSSITCRDFAGSRVHLLRQYALIRQSAPIWLIVPRSVLPLCHPPPPLLLAHQWLIFPLFESTFFDDLAFSALIRTFSPVNALEDTTVRGPFPPRILSSARASKPQARSKKCQERESSNDTTDYSMGWYRVGCRRLSCLTWQVIGRGRGSSWRRRIGGSGTSYGCEGVRGCDKIVRSE
jgi:hypothetical protein